MRDGTGTVMGLALLALAGAARAQSAPDGSDAAMDAVDLDRVTVTGRRLNLVGDAISASEGAVGPTELASRPLARSGDLLEFVPGLVATQHSGSGKANQYFLRGFNLDHGTDFATFVDAMPVNLRTHAHGQGYTDLNFLIPEAVEQLDYRKGPYHAEVGDFASAGSARFALAERMEAGLAQATLGEYGYRRGLVLDSIDLGTTTVLYGGEWQRYDGPWRDLDEDVRKLNALLRLSTDLAGGRASVTALHYDNRWNSPDQIPQRAVERGLIDARGSLDRTLGGASSRSSLSFDWRVRAAGGELAASAYAIDYSLQLFSNFTYLLDDPADGDQFQQADDRRVYGFSLAQQWQAGRSRWRLGADGRLDDIERVGLYRTQARALRSTVREDAVRERSAGVFLAHEFRFEDAWRSYLGLRHDRYHFDVDARSEPRNSGRAADALTSLKASLAWKPHAAAEFYASYGEGFHSNDARGTTIRVDPASGAPAAPVDALVPSRGVELGTRLYFSDRVHATAALWRLRLDSELLFVGDAGTTEAGRPSRRDGIELGVYWFGHRYFEGELEAAYTRARFIDADPAGQRIPGAIPLVLGAGLTARLDNGWSGTLRVRHFGRYPLIEDGRVRSDGATSVSLRVGRQWRRVGLTLDVLNLLDSADHDIDYFYASRLAGEPADGIEDLHYHAFEPRSVRLSLRWEF